MTAKNEATETSMLEGLCQLLGGNKRVGPTITETQLVVCKSSARLARRQRARRLSRSR